MIDNTPISIAVAAGASEVWVLSTGYSCALPKPPDTALASAMHAVALLVQQRLVLELRDRTYPIHIHLIPAPCPVTVTPIDFSQTESLIERARADTERWFADGRPASAHFQDLHHHEPESARSHP